LKILLTVLGASFEFTGIVLVAAPELFPRLLEVRRSVQARLEGLRRWLLLRLGRQGGKTVYAKAGGATAGGFAEARGYASPGKAASVEERLAFLLEQAEKGKKRLDELEDRVGDLPRQWQDDIRAMRAEIEGLVTRRIEEIRDSHIRVRLFGIGFLLAGVPILAYANVI
jgi:hypothetical protein